MASPAPPVHGATPPSALSLGAIVDGKYEVRQVLGAGGFGEVYRVHHRVLRADFALKTLHPGLLLDPGIRERFFREARILMGLIHTNLVPLREVGEWEGLLYLTMDLCPGETLSSLLKRRGRLPAREAARLAIPVLRALEYAHGKGIVHRDLKPANLIVSDGEGGRWEVKVLDFGVAKILHDGGAMDDDGPSLTATGAMVGTLAYMSPEQAQGLEIDARSDLFSMGAVLYQAVTGRRPFEGRNPREIAMKILLHAAPPFEQAGATDADLPGLEALVVRCLAKEPADRPATARDLRHELQGLLGGGRRTDSGPVEPLSATIDRATGPTVPDGQVAESAPGPARRTEAFPPTADRTTGPTVDAPQGKTRPTAAPPSGGGANAPTSSRAEAGTSPSQATAADQAPCSVAAAPRARAGRRRAVALAAAVLVTAAALAWQFGWIADPWGATHTGAAGPASPPPGAAPTKSAGAGTAPASPSVDLEPAKRAHDEAIADAREKAKLSDWQGAEAAVRRARGFRADSEDATAVESAISTGRAAAAFASVKSKALAAIFAEPAAEAHPYRTAIELVRTFAEGPDAGGSVDTAREFLGTLERQEAEAVRAGHEKALAEAREKRLAHDRSGAAAAAARALGFVPDSAEAEGLLVQLKLDQAREAFEAVKTKARAALPTGEPAPDPHPHSAAVNLARAFAEGQDAEPVRQEARAFVKSLEEQEAAAVRAALDSALADARARIRDREWDKAQAAVGRALAFDPSSTEASRVQGELAERKRKEEETRQAVETRYLGAMRTGEEALDRRDYDGADNGFAQALAAKPGDAKATEAAHRARKARADAVRAETERAETDLRRREEDVRRTADASYAQAMAKGEESLASADFDGADARFADALSAKPGDARAFEAAGRAKAARANATASRPKAGFVGRVEGKRQLLSLGGGNDLTEKAVLAGLRWLARHQSRDGHWTGVDFDQQCKGALCAGKGYAYYDVGLTGLSVLAFLGAGHTHTSRDTYLDTQTGKTVVMGEVVKGGLRWLIDQQDEMGCVGSKSSLKYIYNHAIACMALAEAYAMTRSDLFRAPAQKAVDFLLASQNPGRGWRYQARSGETDTSVTGWCFMALRVAEMAGLQVDRTTCATASRYMADVTDSHGLTGYMSRDDAGIKVVVPGRNEDFVNHQTMTALSIFCLLFPDTAARAGSHAAGANALTTDLPTWDREHKTNDYYYWYYGTYALFTYDGPSGPDWQRWNEALIVALLPNQLSRRNGCSEGSWDADDRWGFEGGRVYATALNTLTLEVYYRYASLRGR